MSKRPSEKDDEDNINEMNRGSNVSHIQPGDGMTDAEAEQAGSDYIAENREDD